MYFDLTDDQKLLREQLTALLAARLDHRTLLKLYDADNSFDDGLWRELMTMGLGGVLAPEGTGGLGLDLLTLAVVAECLGAAAAPLPVTANALAAWLLSECGGHEGDVSALISGEKIAAFAVSGTHGWRPEDWSRDEISAVEWGTNADVFIVGLAGGKLGLLRKGEPGVAIAPLSTVDRTRPLARLKFDASCVEVLDADGARVDRFLDAALILTAADARGAGKRAMDMAIDYARSRAQFGKLIGQFQGLKYQLVEMAIMLEPCQPLVWYAAHTWDALPKQTPRAAAIAKAHVTEIAVTVGRAAVEAHGGIGYTWEYPLHLWLKRAMQDRAVFGRPQTHRARAASLAGW